MLSEKIRKLAGHYSSEIDEENFKQFTKELAKLSKRYGVAIQSIGGVTIGKIINISYDADYTSGDLIPKVKWE